MAASDLLDKDNKLAPVNRRISITVLTREGESRLLGGPAMEGNDAVKAIADQVRAQEKEQARAAPKAPAREAAEVPAGGTAKVAAETAARR